MICREQVGGDSKDLVRSFIFAVTWIAWIDGITSKIRSVQGHHRAIGDGSLRAQDVDCAGRSEDGMLSFDDTLCKDTKR